MNIGGLIVVGLGLFLVVVALRNTQGQIFPWFFNQSTTTTQQPPDGTQCGTIRCQPGETCLQINGKNICKIIPIA